MSKKVLIAEKEPVLSCLLMDAFLSEGYRVKAVASGLECRSLLNHFPPDLLIVNEDLQWGSGLGVLESLRENHHPAANVPVILLLAPTLRKMIFPWRFPELTVFSKPVLPFEILNAAREAFVGGGSHPWMG